MEGHGQTPPAGCQPINTPLTSLPVRTRPAGGSQIVTAAPESASQSLFDCGKGVMRKQIKLLRPRRG